MSFRPLSIFLTLCLAFAVQACQPADLPAPLPFAPSNPVKYATPTLFVSPSPTIPATSIPLPTPTPFPYTIKSGDTLSVVAERYSVPLDQLLAANPGINPSALTIGQTIQIPSNPRRDEAEPTPAPAALDIGPARCFPAGGGTWCLAAAHNPFGAPVENIIGQITLVSQNGDALASAPALPHLNILPSGVTLPLAAFFAREFDLALTPRLSLQTATLISLDDPRYLAVRAGEILVQVDASGRSAQVSGRVTLLDTTKTAASIWLAAVAYDEYGEIVGFRRWESREALAGAGSLPFALSVYSLGASIARVDVIVEARP
jgi:LysM repeat protein